MLARRTIQLYRRQARCLSVQSREDRPVDIAIYGATGFTGKLVVEYFSKVYGPSSGIKWALAGRNQEKMQHVCSELGVAPDVPLLVADAKDANSMTKLAQQSKVVLTTVGPYQLYGNELIEACAVNGTDYVDLCGEPNWMHDMIHKHEAAAKQSGARIVFSCGFDSIPFDLGVYCLQLHAQTQFGRVLPRVRGRVRKMRGTWSGGTLASLKATLSAVKTEKGVLDVMRSPFSLTPGFVGPDQPRGNKPIYDEVVGSWVAPFVMATINTKNVHRSNFLLKQQYGADFVYDEMVMTGPGEKGEARAKAVADSTAMYEDKTQPGDGPSREERESGFYDILVVGSDAEGSEGLLSVSVTGDMDPGYGSTSKMIAESAVCLVKDQKLAAGGMWTPASAMGSDLIERLEANAGLKFAVQGNKTPKGN